MTTIRQETPLHQALAGLREHLKQAIIGQDTLLDRLLIALMCDGHLLVEGAPGLAKTKAIKSLCAGIEASFHRIQFTPDLLPGDITGTEIYRPQETSFHFQPGPIFHNLVLADEINRAPAKVQSALLEAMAERQVTIAGTTHPLPELFLVMATQNPIEQSGTYPLPEAQLDRFLMYTKIQYPNAEHEQAILNLNRQESKQKEPVSNTQLKQSTLFQIREAIMQMHMSSHLEQYLIELVVSTRDPSHHDAELARWIDYGASPRASIALDRCARAHAWLQQKDYVSPEDIHAVAYDVLRHRILLNFEAQAEGVTTDDVIDALLKAIPIP
jgi:MoxR-like ATPase